MENKEQFLKHCDNEIERARREYKPSTVWDELETQKGPDASTATATKHKFKLVNLDGPVNEVRDKHTTHFGIVKIFHGVQRVVIWGVNFEDAGIAQRALTDRATHGKLVRRGHEDSVPQYAIAVF